MRNFETMQDAARVARQVLLETCRDLIAVQASQRVQLEVRGMQVVADVERTRHAYEAMSGRADEACTCAPCVNFKALGPRAFPDDLLAFFVAAGIDPAQPSETDHYTEVRPGFHLYCGMCHLFGEAVLTDGAGLGASGAFECAFTAPSRVAPEEFRVEGAVCLTFVAELPWIISSAT